ncbi:MAG: hypothetical protein ACLQDF_04115 [Desulfomonilia bacterium]
MKSIVVLFITVLFAGCGGSGGGSNSEPGTHEIRYDVTGGSGIINNADITYLNDNGIQKTLINEPIPWSYSFRSSSDSKLSLTAVLHGNGTTTLYTTITIDDNCYIEDRTFITEDPITVSGTVNEIITTCPNHGTYTVN